MLVAETPLSKQGQRLTALIGSTGRESLTRDVIGGEPVTCDVIGAESPVKEVVEESPFKPDRLSHGNETSSTGESDRCSARNKCCC